MSIATLCDKHELTHKRDTRARSGNGVATTTATLGTIRGNVQPRNEYDDPAFESDGASMTGVIYFDRNHSIQQNDILVFVDGAGVSHDLEVTGTPLNFVQDDRLWRVSFQEIKAKAN